MELHEVERALVVYAHPDDAEYEFGGTVALLAAQGADVTYVCCTDGSKSGELDIDLTDAEVTAIRTAEQQAAAAVLGVREVVFLGYANGSLEMSSPLRRDIVREIRRTKPDLILTMVPYRDFNRPISNSHLEHMTAGDATIHAAAPESSTARMYPELRDEGLEAHQARELWFPDPSHADKYIDVTSVIDVKVAAFQCHVSQYGERPGRAAWTFDNPDWDPMGAEMSAIGSKIGVKYAEAYRSVKIA